MMAACRPRQRGAAWLAMLALLALALAALLYPPHGRMELQTARNRLSARALAQARDALIGDTATAPPDAAGFLRLPDLGFGVGNVPAEGSAAPNFSGNDKDFTVVGKLPWRTLKLAPLRDGSGECLWYAVSGRFKSTPQTDALNWDTAGQLILRNASGNMLAERAAVLLAAPGAVLDGQQRNASDPAYAQCGGNYDARNYLDPYDGAPSGASNYFPGSANNRIAPDSADRTFVETGDARHNDTFLAIRTGDLFRPLIRRAAFSQQISALLDDGHFGDAAISSNKGTDNVNCALVAAANRNFCRNWKEMLLLARLPEPAPVLQDGIPTAPCARVLLFGGSRTSAQTRIASTDKALPANYLEGENLSSFAAPVAMSNRFSGYSTFRADRPDADLIRCLP